MSRFYRHKKGPKPLIYTKLTRDGRQTFYMCHPQTGNSMILKNVDAEWYLEQKQAVYCPFDPKDDWDRARKLAGIR